jgi:hypothetical protein
MAFVSRLFEEAKVLLEVRRGCSGNLRENVEKYSVLCQKIWSDLLGELTSVLRSWSRRVSHISGRTGAVTRCGSGSGFYVHYECTYRYGIVKNGHKGKLFSGSQQNRGT